MKPKEINLRSGHFSLISVQLETVSGDMFIEEKETGYVKRKGERCP